MPDYVRVRQELPTSTEFEAVEFTSVAGTLKDGNGIKLLPDREATFSDGRPLPEKYVSRLAHNVERKHKPAVKSAETTGHEADTAQKEK